MNNFKNYNREFIENEMKNIEPKHLEFLTKNLFINSGKVCFGPEPSSDKFKKGVNFYNRNLHYTLYYDPENFTLNIFYNSIKDLNEQIFVLINKERVVKIDVKPGHWHIKSLGIFNEIDHVRIDNSESIIYEKAFDFESRELFKIKSHITKNK